MLSTDLTVTNHIYGNGWLCIESPMHSLMIVVWVARCSYKASTAMGQDVAENFDDPKSNITDLMTDTWVGKNVEHKLHNITIQILPTKIIKIRLCSYTGRLSPKKSSVSLLRLVISMHCLWANTSV